MEVLLKLLIAHIITDFFIQPKIWVEDKKEKKEKSKYLYFHVLLTGMIAWLALWDFGYWYVALFIAVTHYVIDFIKVKWFGDNLSAFIMDQIYHISVLFLCALYITQEIQLIEIFLDHANNQNTLLILTGYLIVSTPTGYLVGKATKKWQNELIGNDKNRDSLKDAGMWIGILERILVLTFVLFGQFQAIGFLIAAKSILRFSDNNKANPLKQTEYVLIGTLISFTLALFVGITISHLLT